MHRPKILGRSYPGFAALLAACLVCASAHGQGADSLSDVSSAEPARPGEAFALPSITVTAKVLRQRIDSYVSNISRAYVWSPDHPMARWRTPICPMVAGSPSQEGTFIVDRLSTVLASLNLPVAAADCRPNFFVIATTDPVVTLKDLWHRIPGMDGGRTGFTHFIETARPVRVWYNSELSNEDGVGLNATSTYMGKQSVETRTTAPLQEFWAIPELKSVYVIVDLSAISDLNWEQVTDYIAMAGVAEVNLDAHVSEANSIMSLFAAPRDARPEHLSEWDRSFIRRLYTTDQVDRHQRVSIAKAMFRDVTSDSAK